MKAKFYLFIVMSLFIAQSLSAAVIFEDNFSDAAVTKNQFRFDGTDKGKYTIADGYLELNDTKKVDNLFYTCDINQSLAWTNYTIDTDITITMSEGGISFRDDGTMLYFLQFNPSSKTADLKLKLSDGTISDVSAGLSCPSIDLSKKIQCSIILNESYIVIKVNGEYILRSPLPKSGPTSGKVGLFASAVSGPQSFTRYDFVKVSELSCPIVDMTLNDNFLISGETLKLSYSIENPCPATNVDLYIAVLLPSMTINFYNSTSGQWSGNPGPAIANLDVPRFDHIDGKDFDQIALPSSNPKIDTAGSFLFAAAIAEPGTINFIGDVKTTYIYYTGTTQTTIKLDNPSFTGPMSVEEAIKTRRTIRTFSSTPLTFKQIGQLAWAASGVTEEGQGAFKRAAPSAGALYPIDLYFIVGENCVSGMISGVYKYVPASHSLDFIKSGDYRVTIAEASNYQMWQADAPVIVVLTAEYSRSTGKYGDRGQMYAHQEVGFIGENLLLQGVAMGLKTSEVGAFTDAQIQSVLGVSTDIIPMIVFCLSH
jgi:SagB-type dehydrogenase family enzyme